MSVVLTENAAKAVKQKMEGQEEGLFLRFGVKGGGCSGFEYDFRLDKEFDSANDAKYEYHGVTLVVDRKSELYLDGTTIDYYDGLDRSGFKIENPNAVRSCGCGSSFGV
jgi:iron-sulfur cluster assembly protein